MVTKMKARVIAFYLPQFHPISENDEWWGEGFTEWTNVRKAKPLFKGHYQPRVPADLGYYDLRMTEVREAQAKMAHEAGIEGFMYWHYWFGNGKTILERPFKEVLKSKEPDFPFCLGWANHSWSNKTWTQNKSKLLKQTILLEQTYPGEKDYIEHFYYVLEAFKDSRYITVEGKPLFLIYDTRRFLDIKTFISKWQTLAILNGFKGIYFIGHHLNGWDNDFSKSFQMGFNGIVNNECWNAETKVRNRFHKYFKYVLCHVLKSEMGNLLRYDYAKIIKYLISDGVAVENIYPLIVPQFDRSPRAGRNGEIYFGSTPKLFKIHLQRAIKSIERKDYDHRIIFLRSWNEWGEGNYVEPDTRFGHGYLDALHDILK
jgi:hypothetical protein